MWQRGHRGHVLLKKVRMYANNDAKINIIAILCSGHIY